MDACAQHIWSSGLHKVRHYFPWDRSKDRVCSYRQQYAASGFVENVKLSSVIASVLSQKCEVRRTLGREGRGLGDLRRSENTRTVVLESKTVDFCD